ncbi:MAG: hypothetical protein Q9183_005345, partial [Haloplaca sp. 2 TL-2023]
MTHPQDTSPFEKLPLELRSRIIYFALPRKFSDEEVVIEWVDKKSRLRQKQIRPKPNSEFFNLSLVCKWMRSEAIETLHRDVYYEFRFQLRPFTRVRTSTFRTQHFPSMRNVCIDFCLDKSFGAALGADSSMLAREMIKGQLSGQCEQLMRVKPKMQRLKRIMPCLFTISDKQSDSTVKSEKWGFLASLKRLTVAESVEFEFTSNKCPGAGELESCACTDCADMLLSLQANLTQANGEPLDPRDKILLDLRAAVTDLMLDVRFKDRIVMQERLW